MTAYKTPGVYVEEISTLPPSVAEVSTAIPAFIGYTETGPKIARITSLLDYQQLFGGPRLSGFAITTDANGVITVVTPAAPAAAAPAASSTATASTATASTTAPATGTSTTAPATGTSTAAPTAPAAAPATAPAATPAATPAAAPPPPSGCPTPHFLMYYALSHYFQNGGGDCYIVSIGNYPGPLLKADYVAGLQQLEQEDEPTLLVLTDAVNLPAGDYHDLCQQTLIHCQKIGNRFAIFDVKSIGDPVKLDPAYFRDGIGMNYLAYGAAYYPYLATTINHAYDENAVTVAGPGVTAANAPTMASLKATNTGLYNQVKTALAAQYINLPPSPAIAGIYAAIDRDRGVWKAPANVSIASVVGPVSKLTNDMQDSLNVDPTAGKSINAIRAFTGKGTLVWGARTLAGNDNEWRYISVRRLFSMIEASSRQATSFAVFEPNDMTTWLKVKGTIDSFLYSLWEQGALAGADAASAYYVNVGLGKTMTSQDILEGRMIVEIGIAAVRPAEFIVLRFSHKMQEA